MKLGIVSNFFLATALLGPVAVAEEVGQAKIEAAKHLVEDRLKDPSSVQYKELRYVVEDDAVCGKFNAKNSFGGYGEFEMFVMDSSGELFVMNTDSSRFRIAADKYLNLCLKPRPKSN